MTAPVSTVVSAPAPALARVEVATPSDAGAGRARALAADTLADADESPPGSGLPAGPVRPRSPGAPEWSDDLAIDLLRAALYRRGHVAEVVDGAMAPIAFDPTREVIHGDGGQSETVAAGGAWRVLTYAGAFWVFESGLVLPADEAAGR
jgi:hypothetical protein